MNKNVIAISAGLISPKKDYEEINKKNLYLNYGLLGICSLLHRNGFQVKQYQGEYLQPRELIDIINCDFSLVLLKTPILISVISFLSIEWCDEFTKIIKTEYGLESIVGGKYVVDGNVSWLKNKLPYVDYFAEGDGEDHVKYWVNNAFSGTDNHVCLKKIVPSSPYKELIYPLVHNYKKYNPCIEIARGCGRGCVFCADGNRRQSNIKAPSHIVNEMLSLDNMYEGEDFSLYFQMATFDASKEWADNLLKEMKSRYHLVPWRCTSRVDALKPSNIKTLAETGLKVIDLGIESASKIQLLKMKKTLSPSNYLISADRILKEAYDYGVWVKLNILLSAGETTSSIKETIQWLHDRNKYIKGVSVNIETIYGPNSDTEYFRSLGASPESESALYSNGYVYLNLSPSINVKTAKKYCLELSKLMMTDKDYFDLKKIGYFPRDYSYRDFRKDLQNCDSKKVPFIITTEAEYK